MSHKNKSSKKKCRRITKSEAKRMLIFLISLTEDDDGIYNAYILWATLPKALSLKSKGSSIAIRTQPTESANIANVQTVARISMRTQLTKWYNQN